MKGTYHTFLALVNVVLFCCIVGLVACSDSHKEQELQSKSIAAGIGVAMLEICTESNTQCYERLTATCESGNLRSCTLLGLAYIEQIFNQEDLGENISEEESIKRANMLFKKACDGKNGTGCLMLGVGYGEYNRDKEFLHLACEYGEFVGCVELVVDNEKMLKDIHTAVELGESSAKLQSKEAKDMKNGAKWGYERSITLLQEECKNATVRLEIAKKEYEKLEQMYQNNKIANEAYEEKKDWLNDRVQMEGYQANRYCRFQQEARSDFENFRRKYAM